MMRKITLFVLLTLMGFLVGLKTALSETTAFPTLAQLEWQDYEVGAIVQWNIGIYGEVTTPPNYACRNGRTISPDKFSPSFPIDTDAWIRTAKDFGARYAVLTTQAGCGFLLWNTTSTIPNDQTNETAKIYPYTTASSPSFRGQPLDIVRQFVESCRKMDVRPGIYYQIANNVFCNVTQCVIGATSPCGNQADYDNLVIQQVTELWTRYGDLAELWFDGGIDSGAEPTPGSLQERIADLVSRFQPNAVAFQGPGKVNGIRWVGSETGTAALNSWSTTIKGAADYGAGSPDGRFWAPAECDVTLQANGQWYWQSDAPLRTVSELAEIYEKCVGRNGNLLLAVHPKLGGEIDATHAKRGREFAAWRDRCYGSNAPLLNKTTSTIVLTKTNPVIVLNLPTARHLEGGRIVVEEQQESGQRIRGFRVEALATVATTSAMQRGDGNAATAAATWILLTVGESVGHKRIIPINTSDTISAVRLTLTRLPISTTSATIRHIGVYSPCKVDGVKATDNIVHFIRDNETNNSDSNNNNNNSDDSMTLHIIDQTTHPDAACLDGSPPGFYHRSSNSADAASKFVIFLEGGGWCGDGTSSGADDNFESCSERADTGTGSSKDYPKQAADYGGVLSRSSTINPHFANWTHVFVKYCDGSSMSGYRNGTVSVLGRELYFRGRRNLEVTVDTLLSSFGLADATEIVLSGGSAGGLAVMLNVDFVRDRVRRRQEQARRSAATIVGFPDAGFFLDYGNWFQNWQRAIALWGSASNLPPTCVEKYKNEGGVYKCMMAEYVLPHVDSPLFVLNSDIDMWSIEFILGIKCGGWPPAPWPPQNCSSDDVSKIAQWRKRFRDVFVPALQGGNDTNGAFVDTCVVHEQNVDYCSSQGVANCVGWNTYEANGWTPQTAFGEWYATRNDESFVILDSSEFPTPGNPTCFQPKEKTRTFEPFSSSRPAIEVLGVVDLLTVEQTPIVLDDGSLMHFESVRTEYMENVFNGTKQYFRIVGAFSGQTSSPFAVGYAFGCAHVENGDVYAVGTLGANGGMLGRVVTLFKRVAGKTTWENVTLIDWRNATGNDDRDIANTSLERGMLNGALVWVLAFEIADPKTPGQWQTRFAKSESVDPMNAKDWETLDPNIFSMGESVEHANPTLRYNDADGYWYCITARNSPVSGSWYFFTEVARSSDLKSWTPAPGMGSVDQIGNPLLAPNRTVDLAVAPSKWSNVHEKLLRGIAPFLDDVTDVNTSDMDLVQFENQTVIFFCAGQQHYDNLLVVAVSDMPLNAFLSGWFGG